MKLHFHFIKSYKVHNKKTACKPPAAPPKQKKKQVEDTACNVVPCYFIII